MTKKDEIPEISQRIRQLRERMDLSQKALGKLVGVTDAAVTNWETGIRFPRGNNLKKLATALGVTESEILDAVPLKKLDKPSLVDKPKELENFAIVDKTALKELLRDAAEGLILKDRAIRDSDDKLAAIEGSDADQLVRLIPLLRPVVVSSLLLMAEMSLSGQSLRDKRKVRP